MNYTQVDIILWIFLQNIALVPYEYVLETEEYDIFKYADKNNHIFILSCNDIKFDISYINLKKYKNSLLYFTSFENMLYNLLSILDKESYKRNLIVKSLDIMKKQSIEIKLENLHI